VILVDAGPLVAVVDDDDQHHGACRAEIDSLAEPMGTVWPVLAEAMYLLRYHSHGQEAVWKMVARGVVQLLPLGLDDIPRIRELMAKYSDRRMELADAALIRVAEREGIRKIFTVDRDDFNVYRLHGAIRPRITP
jgi:predicted nucleic acid-binding protein